MIVELIPLLRRDLCVEINNDISWANISKKYFGKSRSWLSQKMNGFDGNGSITEFTKEEQQTLKNALYDLSNRIKICADKL